MDKSGFSTTCKESLEDALAQRVSDFRLDAALQVRLRAVGWACCYAAVSHHQAAWGRRGPGHHLHHVKHVIPRVLVRSPGCV